MMPDLLPVTYEKCVGILLLPKHKALTVGRVTLLLGRGSVLPPKSPLLWGLFWGVQGTPLLLGMQAWDVPGSWGWGVSSKHQPLLQKLPVALFCQAE